MSSFFCINPLAYKSAFEANEALINYVNKNSYFDLFLTNICYQKAIFPETVEFIKSKGIPTLGFRSDNLTIPYFDKITGPHFDLLWLTSSETAYLYDKWKINTIFLPYAANPFFFEYRKPQVIIKNVCFIGTPYGSRPIMINELTEHGITTDVYYKRNENLQVKEVKSTLKSSPVVPNKYQQIVQNLFFSEGRKVFNGIVRYKFSNKILLKDNSFLNTYPSVMSNELSTVYSNYVLALSSTSSRSTELLKNPLSVLNLRSFEVPMSGGIQFCKYNEELANYFEEDKEIVFYRDNEELVDKARFYTHNAKDQDIYKI